jgi:hypothetical protein
MDLYFLEADRPLTKTITPDETAPYPMALNFTSHEEKIESISKFHTTLQSHAEQGHCLLKGTLKHPLVDEPRAGSTKTDNLTQWICLDIDGLPTRNSTPGKILKKLGLDNIAYVVQDSASQGVKPGLRCHVFMMLDKPVPATSIKVWLQALNLEHFREDIKLTASHVALRYPLDVTVCQEDKLIYIAPPVFRGMADPVQRKRIRYSKGGQQTLESSRILSVDPKSVDKGILELTTALRQELGLPASGGKLGRYGSQTVMLLKHPNKEGGAVTGIRSSRGYVYLNLNGGDSWGYYHPESDPKLLYNFKGEPTYKTKEIDPEYYAAAMEVLKAAKAEAKDVANDYHSAPDEGFTGRRYFAAIDKDTGGYLYGQYDYDTDELDLIEGVKKANVIDYLKEHGQPVPDFLPTWTYSFDFTNPRRFSATAKHINRFHCPKHFNSPRREVAELPPITRKVMFSAVGGSEESLLDLLHCLAYLLQRRESPKTAFVLYGTQGTGKGLLVDRILSSLLGHDAVSTISVSDITSDYNSFLSDKLVVQIDEIDVNVTKHYAKAISEMKKLITADYVWVNQKFVQQRKVKNHVLYILSSNKPNPTQVDPNDRRFHVAEYQNTKLIMTDAEIRQLSKEIEDLFHFLMQFDLDVDRARTPRETASRQNVQYLTRSSVDESAEALLHGNLEFFIENMPSSDSDEVIGLENATVVRKYKETIRTAFQCAIEGNPQRLQRDRVRSLLQHLIGNVPKSPNKFTKYMRHHGIEFKRMRIDSKPEYGVEIDWKLSAEMKVEYKDFMTQQQEKKYVRRENRDSEERGSDHLQ